MGNGREGGGVRHSVGAGDTPSPNFTFRTIALRSVPSALRAAGEVSLAAQVEVGEGGALSVAFYTSPGEARASPTLAALLAPRVPPRPPPGAL